VTLHYEAFGAAIRSNHPLAGLRATEAGEPDIAVEFEEGRAPEVDPRADASTADTGWGAVHACEDGGRLLLYASHGGERAWSLRVSGDGTSIEVRWRGPIELGDIAAFVATQGLPTALVLRGVPLLHGCAVDTGAAAFLVLGPGGAGKSTIAAAAVAGGRALLSDDIAALDASGSEVRVHPGATQLRMYAESTAALGWDPSELRRLFATPALPSKLFATLSAEDGSLCAEARRVAAIFVLGERHQGPVRIERLAPAAALTALLGNTFGERAVDAQARARLLPLWTRVVEKVPVHAVTPPDGLDAVPELVEALAAAAGARPAHRADRGR
jgi:hypothetical protein